MGRMMPLAVVGGVLGYGLWWLAGLLPIWDLSSYLWYFAGTGAFGLVTLNYLVEEGKNALRAFLGWGAFMAFIFAVSWGGGWALERGLFGGNPSENLPVYFMVGIIALMAVGYSVWEGRKDRNQQRMIEESKERTRQRRERRRQGIRADDLRGEPESGERP